MQAEESKLVRSSYSLEFWKNCLTKGKDTVRESIQAITPVPIKQWFGVNPVSGSALLYTSDMPPMRAGSKTIRFKSPAVLVVRTLFRDIPYKRVYVCAIDLSIPEELLLPLEDKPFAPQKPPPRHIPETVPKPA